MFGQDFELHITSFKKESFCGKEYYAFEGGIFRLPFKIEPTQGEHDYNTCDSCKANLQKIAFNVRNKLQKFPDCCEYHSNLKNQDYFNKRDFEGIETQIAQKVVFSFQHINNNINNENWYDEITDYLDYVIASFGSFTVGCGEPFCLASYLKDLLEFLNNNKREMSELKRKKLTEYVDSNLSPKDAQTDLNVLFSTYEKWLKIFPFEMSYFSGLKEYYEANIPFLKEKPMYNPYLKLWRAKLQDKDSLIEMLLKRTNHILTHLNGLKMYENGLISDADNIKLELIISNRKMQLDAGYINDSKDESQRYRRILKQWFEHEKKFIDEIKPLLKPEGEKPKRESEENKNINVENNFDNVPVNMVYSHFKKGLVEKGYLEEGELMEFLKQAFELKETPSVLFRFQNLTTKQKVIKVFYEYYKTVAGKPHRKQRIYAALLANYFEGFKLDNVVTNFNK